ncbi:hypothetical protein ACET3Z_020779 [Daucus carota]
MFTDDQPIPDVVPNIQSVPDKVFDAQSNIPLYSFHDIPKTAQGHPLFEEENVAAMLAKLREQALQH